MRFINSQSQLVSWPEYKHEWNWKIYPKRGYPGQLVLFDVKPIR